MRQLNWLLHGEVARFTEMVSCLDGVRLATDIYVSEADGAIHHPRPTIVERTPYGRRDPELQDMAQFFATRGYNVVLQDTRGRGGSEGVFQHYLAKPHEGEDGHELLDWISAQDWSDGTVGTTGLSYTGSNQQSLAITNHPALRCQAIFDAGMNYFRRTVREEGAFVHGQLGTYALRMALSSPQARQDPVMRMALERARDNAIEWFRKTPWTKGNSPVSALPEYEDWLLFAQDTVEYGPGWDNPQMNIEPYLDKYPDIPILYVTSWYGHHAWSTFRRLEVFADHVTPKRTIVGTWLHADPYGHDDHVGDVSFGPDSSLNMNEIRLRWFDAHLRGNGQAAVAATPSVNYFRMGGGAGTRDSNRRLAHGGTWLQTDTWPPNGSQHATWYLKPDRTLGQDASLASETLKLSVDLKKPVPTVGGSIKNPDIMPGFFIEGGRDQRESDRVMDSPGSNLPLAARQDVAAFRGGVLQMDTDITGPLFLELWISSTSPACDLSVKIVDEYPKSADWPEGFALNIADSYQRFASWTEEISDVKSQPMRVTVGPIHISNLFAEGHRIRVDVSNSNWPRFDRNPESHERFDFQIHCDGDFASRLYGECIQRVSVKEDQS